MNGGMDNMFVKEVNEVSKTNMLRTNPNSTIICSCSYRNMDVRPLASLKSFIDGITLNRSIYVRHLGYSQDPPIKPLV
jgi:hypothetical protein